MGVVYRAHDESLRRDVALKVMPRTDNEERRQRFLREARSAAGITHPNVAVVHQIGEEEGRIYIAMELVNGESLRQRLERGPFAEPTALQLAGQIAQGLAAAHDRGIVHRDLKPENVMITTDGVVKLLDFGLAKTEADTRSADRAAVALAKTETLVTSDEGRVMGTPEYMSPEQALGEPLDVRSDVFSFGIVLYEMLAGKRPFSGASTGAVMVAIARDSPPPLRERVPSIDATTEAVVNKCLAKAPAERFADAGEIVAALAKREVTKTATTQSRTEVQPLSRSASVSTGAGSSRSWRTAALLLGVVAAAILAGWRWVAVRSSRQTAAAPAAASARTFHLADLPASQTSVPAAEAAFRRGMKLLAGGEVSAAQKALDEAIAADDSFASPHLQRLLLATYLCPTPLAPARTHFQAVARARSTISARDQDVLTAIEPAVFDPPDLKEGAVRMHALAARRPDDMQVLELLAIAENKLFHFERSAEIIRRAMQVDPDESAIGGLLLAQDLDDAEGRRVLDELLARNSAAEWTRVERTIEHAWVGQCHEVESDARMSMVFNPEYAMGPWWLAQALAGQDASTDALRFALADRRSRLDPGRADRVKPMDDALLSIWGGDFTAALASIDAYGTQASPDAAVAKVETLVESGDTRQAGDVALAYVKQAAALPRFERPETDPLPRMLARAHLAGVLSDTDYSAQREAWIASWRARLDDEAWATAASVIWAQAFEHPANEAEAKAAVERLRAFGGNPPPIASRRFWADDGPIGELFLLGGRPDDALARLRPAAARCALAMEPVQASLRLGEALEQMGDTKGACDAYARVTERWGRAKPRSVSADEARAHAQKLACNPTP
jgi:eukaryotic-like serine/threonine-protein kinase